MNYEGQICRGPMERSSCMLPVAVGCSYNRCKFCNLFKHLTYRELPLEQIEAELLRIRNLGGNPTTVFLGDGNAFGLKTEQLLHISDLIHQYFPNCSSINMDATIQNIRQKNSRELAALCHAGIRHLYLGIESGIDDVLAFMNKGHNLAQAYEAIHRLQEAGLVYDAHIMTRVAGEGRGLENASCLAEFFNRTNPQRIINFSLFICQGVQLYQEVVSGHFVPADELENLIEERKLLELIETGPLLYDGFHDHITFRVRGQMPADKDKMLRKLDETIARYQELAPVTALIKA